jgi:hypothetical protein
MKVGNRIFWGQKWATNQPEFGEIIGLKPEGMIEVKWDNDDKFTIIDHPCIKVFDSVEDEFIFKMER